MTVGLAIFFSFRGCSNPLLRLFKSQSSIICLRPMFQRILIDHLTSLTLLSRVSIVNAYFSYENIISVVVIISCVHEL